MLLYVLEEAEVLDIKADVRWKGEGRRRWGLLQDVGI